MKFLLFYILCTLSLYYPSSVFISTFQIDHNPNFDDLIDKLLKSDKFDELANKIADKAVEKIKYLQNGNISKNNNNLKNELSYRNSGEKNVTTQNVIEKSLFDDDFVKSLIKREPFDNLSLKYVRFVKNKPKDKNINISTQDSISIENTITSNSSEVNFNEKKKRKGDHKQQKNKTVEKGTLSKEERLKMSTSDSISDEDSKHKTNNKINSDNIENENKENARLFESEQILIDDSYELNFTNTTDNNNTSIINESKDIDEMKLSEEIKYTDVSAEKTTPKNKVSTKSKRNKRVLRKENDRVYFLESSSEYDGYRDKIYDALGE